MTKAYQFTHSDLDGVGCAVVAKIAFRDVVTEFVDYNNVEERLRNWLDHRHELPKNGQQVLLITDITPKDPQLCLDIMQLHASKEVYVINVDHHKTVFESLGPHRGMGYTVHDIKKCATWLLQAFMPEEFKKDYLDGLAGLDEFAEAVDSYDRWVLESPERERGEDLNRLLWFIGFEEFVREFDLNIYADHSRPYSDIERYLREKEKRTIKEIIEEQTPSIFTLPDGRRFAYLTLTSHASQVGNELLKKMPEVDFVVMTNPRFNTVELRSRKGGADVSEVAKRAGGGGHQAAAGFNCDFSGPIFEAMWHKLKGQEVE